MLRTHAVDEMDDETEQAHAVAANVKSKVVSQVTANFKSYSCAFFAKHVRL